MLRNAVIATVLTIIQLSVWLSDSKTLIDFTSSPSQLQTVSPGRPDSTASPSNQRCAPALPRGCSCSRNDGFSSITCSGVRLTSVPKNWVDVGNSVVKTLNLERNNISEVNIGDFFGVKIERLLLGNNSLRELNFLSFWGLEYSLDILDLSYNRFRRVPFEALRLLRNLRSLSLTGNEISALRDFDFGYMRKLEVLALDRNPISSVDRHAFVGTQLSLLNFDWIQLASNLSGLPTDDLRYVTGLSLAHNRIATIPPDWLRNLNALRYLSLDDNAIATLHPDAFRGVETSLKTLELNHNRLSDVPTEALRRLANLELLELANNKIRRVHRRAFNSSSNLQSLDLSHNRISKLSKRAFVGLDSIQRLDLRHNRLITLDDTTFAPLKSSAGRNRAMVYIADNPWLCNCILKWVKEELDKRTASADETHPLQLQQQQFSLFADDPVCERPKFYHDQPVGDVPLDEFTCDHDYYYYYYEKEDNTDNDENGDNNNNADDDDNNNNNNDNDFDNDDGGNSSIDDNGNEDNDDEEEEEEDGDKAELYGDSDDE